MIQISDGVVIPIIIKTRLPYIERYYSTDEQMLKISREEIMTSKNECDSNKYDDLSDTAKVCL